MLLLFSPQRLTSAAQKRKFPTELDNLTATSAIGSLRWLSVFHHVAEYSAEAVALLTNSILVYLIVTETKREYRDYRRVLLLNCIVDYICTIVGILIQPHFEIIDGQWISIISPPLSYFPQNVRLVLNGWYAFSNSFGITCIPIQFYFRRTLICDEIKLPIHRLIILTLITFTSSCVCGSLFAWCFIHSHGKPFPTEAILKSGLVLSNDPKDLINAEMISLPMILLLILAFISNTTVLSLVTLFSYQILRRLRLLHHEMHPRTRNMQRQMNVMLMSQTVSVFAVGCVPMLFLLIIMATRVNVLGAGTIISVFLSFVPVCNPISTLVLVAEFRRRLMKITGLVQRIASTTQIHSKSADRTPSLKETVSATMAMGLSMAPPHDGIPHRNP